MITESHLTPGAVGTGRGDAVIETTGLTRYFGARKAVDGLTMAVPRGSVFAFLGRNGSGKTTTIRMLLGLTEPTRGSSRVLGEDSQHLTPEIRAPGSATCRSRTRFINGGPFGNAANTSRGSIRGGTTGSSRPSPIIFISTRKPKPVTSRAASARDSRSRSPWRRSRNC